MKCRKLRDSVSIDIIKQWLSDSDCDVRLAAMNACNDKIHLIKRTIDPPEKVYKKCWNNVIVVAHIPDDAMVRGMLGAKCRASKAEIIDVIGDICGKKIGISAYDY